MNITADTNSTLSSVNWDNLINTYKEDVSTCVYEVAVVSLVKSPNQFLLIKWLLENRNEDGTWGANENICWYDTYICTFAAFVSFENSNMAELAKEAHFCLTTIKQHDDKSIPETFTFGGLIDTLERFRHYRGRNRLNHSPIIQKIVQDENDKWSKMISWDKFYDYNFSVAGYCGERIYGDDRVDIDQFLNAFQTKNGSITNVPGASALTYLDIERRGTVKQTDQVYRLQNYLFNLNPYKSTIGVLDFFPHFVTAWSLMFISELKIHYSDIRGKCKRLQTEEMWSYLQYAQQFKVVSIIGQQSTLTGDADSTSCLLIACQYAGYTFKYKNIMDYIFDSGKGYYKTFLFERNPSVSTNIHTAQYLYKCEPESSNLTRVIDWLESEIQSPETFVCKWHLSPLYSLGEAARILASISNPKSHAIAIAAAEQILKLQHSNGGWGVSDYTVEETGYAVLGLASILQNLADDESWAFEIPFEFKENILQALLRAEEPLQNKPVECIPLWIGKSLYCVKPIVPIIHRVSLERIKQIRKLAENSLL
jgi:hypothetical protein